MKPDCGFFPQSAYTRGTLSLVCSLWIAVYGIKHASVYMIHFNNRLLFNIYQVSIWTFTLFIEVAIFVFWWAAATDLILLENIHSTLFTLRLELTVVAVNIWVLFYSIELALILFLLLHELRFLLLELRFSFNNCQFSLHVISTSDCFLTIFVGWECLVSALKFFAIRLIEGLLFYIFCLGLICISLELLIKSGCFDAYNILLVD